MKLLCLERERHGEKERSNANLSANRAGNTDDRPSDQTLSQDQVIKPADECNVSFGFLNARSVRNKTTEVTDFMLDNHLDILGICETWLSEDDNAIIGQLAPTGFTFKHVPRISRRGGGVALLFRSELHVDVTCSLSSYQSFEFIEGNIISGLESIRLVVIYRPPGSKCPLSKFFEEFSAFLDGHLFTSGSLIISGDFNIHVNKKMSQTTTFEDVLRSHMDLSNISTSQRTYMDTLWTYSYRGSPMSVAFQTLESLAAYLIIMRLSASFIFSDPRSTRRHCLQETLEL